MLNPEIAANRRPIDRLSRNGRLAALAQRVQPVIVDLLAAAGTPVRNVVHGTLLGHPLHAIVTDIPIGAWSVTAALDLAELVGAPSGSGADAALVIGLAGAAGAAITGFADWSDTADDPRTLGMAHAAVNGLAVAAYLGSLALRRRGRRRAGLLVGLAAYGVAAGAAYLGGELSFGYQLGVKHTAEPLAPPAEYTPVLDAAALGALPVRAELDGIPILLTRTGAGVAAISAVCTHRGAPLSEGTFEDGCVRCPWHGSAFSLRDGRVVNGPATFPQPRFAARIKDDRIEVCALAL